MASRVDDDDNDVEASETATACSVDRRVRVRSANVADRLRRREQAGRAGLSRSAVFSPLFYAHFKLRCELRIHEESDRKYRALSSYVRTRSRILELTNAGGLIFALTQAGLCVAFAETTAHFLCYLNTSPGEVVRSMFYNKLRDELILVSVFPIDDFASLQCRCITLDAIRRGVPEGRARVVASSSSREEEEEEEEEEVPPPRRLFASEQLCWPGFVEFDELNGKVVTFSAEQKVYTVWSLSDYRALFTVANHNILEIKISPGIMLLVYNRTPSHIPLKVLSLDTGEELYASAHLLHRRKKIEIVEQFGDKILIKQQDEDLYIVDIVTRRVRAVPQSRFVTPRSFVFLAEKQLFLTVRGPLVQAWNFDGEQVTAFEDHLLHVGRTAAAVTHINSSQDVIFSYCAGGSINISSIVTGKLLGKITTKSLRTTSSAMSKHADYALEQVCTLCFNEATHEIYVGNELGFIYILN